MSNESKQSSPIGDADLQSFLNKRYDKFFGDGYWEKEYKKHIVIFAELCVNEYNQIAGSQWASSAHPIAVNGDEEKGNEVFYYCQHQIEDGDKCTEQCDSCRDYYAPLEKERKSESQPKAAALKADDDKELTQMCMQLSESSLAKEWADVKSKEIESAETILGCWALTGPEPYDKPVTMEKDSILQAMEEYANQFKSQQTLKP